MFPLDTMNDHSDALMIYAKFAGYFSHGVSFLGNIISNLYHLSFGKFFMRVLFSKVRPSAFGKRIFQIVRIGSEEQMVRPNAIWNVAPMQNTKGGWNISEPNHPRKPVGRNAFTHYSSQSVTEFGSSSMPQPTAASLFDFKPKPFRNSPVPIVPCSDFFRSHVEMLSFRRLYNNIRLGLT
jgi:hypothetical protein